ncbi:MAG: hydroxyacid dehydrogenase [Mesorhizobium sp.]|uniref:hydroxyacid dehydrogenase n=3 Tax=Mesorhizobium sp. TaxID=1871066 RepID=UPI000FE3EE7E|nr:hydroxyacid dehydrogenase [Mesorhizobium sp.]RWH67998.1 MAG: hydroxyacid dehydrogenase [Mesorhizobium sp.]RWL21100.1 MAG: hydroxyacid dehydrogenase [Mesorhizobium sp.]RWL24954.1 MAG: hydroxyacid dehydrogenase [Mesorhizobium sp.]RWL29332.1 MAG: hydroxyacid dehydrogenase [Mesorhizobium sp.]RWL51675.1 MAG: hydroxyacid dehydrogenase [Mesorhizobium sp.]
MRKILSTHPLHPRATAMLVGAGRLVVASALDPKTLTTEARDADIVIVRAPLPPELFAGASSLRAAIRHGAGLDMIPVEAASAAGVLVANVPAVNARSVAEHVMFMALALLRRFRVMDRDLRAKGWLAGREHANSTSELAGKTIGIVGLGAVGQAIGHIAAQGFDLNVVATTRSLRPAPERVGFLSIDALVEQSDIVVLCCPLTEETRGLISRERIARMKPNALLINVSRGPVVDDEALIEALQKGRIGGAALDVFSTQPLPPNHPYFGFDNVIVTPHMAGITEESMMRMGVGAAGEALLVLAGKLPVNLRNPEVIEHYRRRFPAGD